MVWELLQIWPEMVLPPVDQYHYILTQLISTIYYNTAQFLERLLYDLPQIVLALAEKFQGIFTIQSKQPSLHFICNLFSDGSIVL